MDLSATQQTDIKLNHSILFQKIRSLLSTTQSYVFLAKISFTQLGWLFGTKKPPQIGVLDKNKKSTGVHTNQNIPPNKYYNKV